MNNAQPPRWSRREISYAWLVHAFTLTGFIWATLAVVALLEGQLTWMWFWLAVALVVDGVDGNLARAARVSEVIPWFSGETVDHIVDYLTWTAIPVLFMVLYLPLGPRPLALSLAILILVSSMWCYANEGAKSGDNYFVGFPAAWNLVAVVLWVWHAPHLVVVVTIIGFSLLTVVPLHYTHPFRVRRGRAGHIAATALWVLSMGALVVNYHPGAGASHAPLGWQVLNCASAAWLIASGVRRSLRRGATTAGQN